MQTLKEFFNRLFSSLRKRKLTKGFSLIELLVVVGIMGLLAAIAIPAYNRYRTTAQVGVIQATISNIQRAWPACLTTDTFAGCANDNINGTVNPSSMDSRIYSNMTAQNACFAVELGGTLGTGMAAGMPDFSGCIGFENDNVGTQQNTSQGWPIGSDCTKVQPNPLCTGGTGGVSPTAGTITSGAAGAFCGTFGCQAGTNTGTCPTGAGTLMANNVDSCKGGNTSMSVVAECDAATAECQ